MERITEKPLDPNVAKNLPGAINDGLKLLNFSDPDADPAFIVELIDTFVFHWQQNKRPSPVPHQTPINPDDIPFALGPLWASQLIRQFQWQWATLTFLDRQNSTATGVVSPDRSLAIFPMHFILGCLKNPNVDAVILLSFNMLLLQKVPPSPPNEYLNLMQHVHRIVPRL